MGTSPALWRRPLILTWPFSIGDGKIAERGVGTGENVGIEDAGEVRGGDGDFGGDDADVERVVFVEDGKFCGLDGDQFAIKGFNVYRSGIGEALRDVAH